MSKLGAPLRAFCEADTLLHSLLTLTHPTSLSASQSEKGEWKLWDIPKSSVVWVFGGPSCTSLSTAGKQLAGKDPTSRYLFDHLAMAAAFGASLILLENVLPLVETDSEHTLYTQLLQQAAALGYVLVQEWKLEDAQHGGFTQRARVFLIWEKSALHVQLPSWQQTVTLPPALSASKIADALLPLTDLPETVWLEGRTCFNSDTPIKLHRATKVGFILRKPTLANVSVGTLVARKTLTKGKNTWRVMAFHQGRIELRRADRKQPDFAMVSPAELAYTIGDKIPLYHPDGIGVGLRRWGEPPLRSAFAIIQQTDQG
jgi:site-specific DNA-cytosine methylase